MPISHRISQEEFRKLSSTLLELGFQVPEPEFFPITIQLQFGMLRYVEEMTYCTLDRKKVEED